MQLLLDNRTYGNLLSYMPDEDKLNKISMLFTLFSDQTRLIIISALSISQMCVNDLSIILAANQTTISHQLKILRTVNAVKYRRQGKVLFYSLADPVYLDILAAGAKTL